ncbi:MAG: PTS system mannose/fructose/sorbose family transporter subunit IID [Candidatus Krumholzibacteriia bacterium]
MSGAGQPGLGRGTRLRVWLWSLGLQGSWNPQRMQNLGLLAALVAWRRGVAAPLEADRLFCRRYYEFFNTNPYLANYLIGGLIRLEQDRLAGQPLPAGLARTYRDSLGRALASLGDQLFWMGLRPALTLLICLLAVAGPWWAPLGVVGAFAAGQLVLRWVSLGRGLALGMDLVEVLAARRWHRAIAAVRRAGMILAGLLLGYYLFVPQPVGGSPAGLAAAVAAGAGLVLPLLLRRRLPGEVLILAAGALAFALSFAIPALGG